MDLKVFYLYMTICSMLVKSFTFHHLWVKYKFHWHCETSSINYYFSSLILQYSHLETSYAPSKIHTLLYISAFTHCNSSYLFLLSFHSFFKVQLNNIHLYEALPDKKTDIIFPLFFKHIRVPCNILYYST
jgi:hypothetical protein